MEKTYKVQPSVVAGITISTRVMGQRTIVEVKDREVLNQIIAKINQAKYVFDFIKSMLGIVRGKNYYVELYAGDGSPPKVLGLLHDEFRINGICWQSDSYLVQDCFDYIEKVYNDALSGNAEQLQ